MNYTIQQLNYLIALDYYGNFSRAAESCFVSQPTLSMQIKKLENDLGVAIVDRSKQPLVFTAVGKRILEQAKSSIGELKVIDDIISESKGEVSGELHVGIIPTLAPYLVPLFIGGFLKKYPNVKLKLTEYKTEEIIERLLNDKLDIGILATPLNEIGISEDPIFYEKLLSYSDPELTAKYGNRVTIDEILSSKLWVLSEGNCFRNQTFNLCHLDQTAYKSFDFEYESGSIETLIRLVDREGGTTIIPELALDTLTPEQIDRVKFIEQTNPVREVSIVKRRKGLKASIIKVLREEIRGSIPKSVLENDKERQVVAL
jgi:LysR family transcriptional regulator, hydrogen peroxide-inducible genes activator